ncbi:hypothetical protein SUGI_0264100 [Cryptomeria japonica]|nr:hypothetical protein SUGI_0264100 [Cryptomeria japonica]
MIWFLTLRILWARKIKKTLLDIILEVRVATQKGESMSSKGWEDSEEDVPLLDFRMEAHCSAPLHSSSEMEGSLREVSVEPAFAVTSVDLGTWFPSQVEALSSTAQGVLSPPRCVVSNAKEVFPSKDPQTP